MPYEVTCAQNVRVRSMYIVYTATITSSDKEKILVGFKFHGLNSRLSP